MTSIIVRALDSFSDSETRQGVIDRLLKYVHTDSVCYMQDYPESFIILQEKHWVPLHSWLKDAHNIDIKTTNGISPIKQDADIIDKFRAIIESYDDFKLAAFEKAVLRAKSFIIGFALIEKQISVDEAVTSSSLEVIQQINKVH
jgi:ATP synthase mitochondrial F1 complex assembly factor 2